MASAPGRRAGERGTAVLEAAILLNTATVGLEMRERRSEGRVNRLRCAVEHERGVWVDRSGARPVTASGLAV